MVGFEPPKLAAWSGWAALDPAGGGVAGVEPADGAGADLMAAARSRGDWNAAAARFTAGENVRAPSVDTATIGAIGASFGASSPAGSYRQPTATTSSLPLRRCTASPEMGRSRSLGLVATRLSLTSVVTQVAPKSVERPTNTLPLTSPSWVSHPSRA